MAKESEVDHSAFRHWVEQFQSGIWEKTPGAALADERIRVVNPSRNDAIEVLLVNCSKEAARPHFLRNAPAALVWTMGTRPDAEDTLPQEILAGAWLWGRDQDKVVGAA